jgi:putative membrane protein
MMYKWDYVGNGHDWAGFLVMLMWWVLVLLGILLIVRFFLLGRTSGARSNSESALDILNKRYASGEIDRKEYEEKRKDIGH